MSFDFKTCVYVFYVRYPHLKMVLCGQYYNCPQNARRTGQETDTCKQHYFNLF